MSNKILIVIPTYNESENVVPLLVQICDEKLKVDILFVDDNSPDGTGELIERQKKKHKNLQVLHRKGKEGIGSAHQAGINYAYEKQYEFLITMDSDFSHSPAYIPRLLEEAGTADIVVGSRYLQEKSLADWSLMRKILTHTGHLLTRILLGMKFDASNAFRLYDLKVIDQRIFGLVQSKSYSFFFESLFILYKNGLQITEIPIVLPKRTYGRSKMTFKDIYRSLSLLFKIFIRHKIFRSTVILAEATQRRKK